MRCLALALFVGCAHAAAPDYGITIQTRTAEPLTDHCVESCVVTASDLDVVECTLKYCMPDPNATHGQ